MKFLKEFYQWMFKRVPPKFSIALIALFSLHLLIIVPGIVAVFSLYILEPGRDLVETHSGWRYWFWLIILEVIVPQIVTLIILACSVLGFFGCYWIAVKIYKLRRRNLALSLDIHSPVLPVSSLDGTRDDKNPLKKFNSIGIILAGGGAKGAYQAGAMKAIYEFLEKHQSHHKVRMIAGTSIGSWNALFWLAGLVKNPAPNQPSLLEQWWSTVEAKSVIEPTNYMPTRQNYFLSNEPWRKTFDIIFSDNEQTRQRLLHHIEHPDAADAMHFYFTRANVKKAALEFTTNRRGLDKLRGNLRSNRPSGHRRPRPVVSRGSYELANSVEDIRQAVFSSMDIPPLFQYSAIGDEFYEDGGVIDNLPIRFGTELEGCDLLFVLPLNANFDEHANTRSLIRRLIRVMNVRQGVLERHSFKLVYLYNELAGLREQSRMDRERAQKYEEILKYLQKQLDELSGQTESNALPMKEIARELEELKQQIDGHHVQTNSVQAKVVTRAESREHKMVQVFSICPDPNPLINTAEFWKTTEAGRAFRLMYTATMHELEDFDFENADPSWIRMAQVSQFGRIAHFSDF